MPVVCSPNLSDSTGPLAVRCWLSYGQFNISNLTCGADRLLFAPITVHFSGYGTLRILRDRLLGGWKSCLNMISRFSTILVSNMAMLTLCQGIHASNVSCQLPEMGEVGLVNLVTWFPALSSSEQRQLQQSDKELKQVLAWVKKDQCPALFPKNSGY